MFDLAVTRDETSFMVSALRPSTAYQYRVRAFNARGPSGNSNVVTAGTNAPPQVTAACTPTGTIRPGFEFVRIHRFELKDAAGVVIFSNNQDDNTTASYEDFTGTGRTIKVKPGDVLTTTIQSRATDLVALPGRAGRIPL